MPKAGAYKITASGAQGGGGGDLSMGPGAPGAMVSGVFEFSQGDQLTFVVGAGGGSAGGPHGNENGGGGGSFVVKYPANNAGANPKPLLIAETSSWSKLFLRTNAYKSTGSAPNWCISPLLLIHFDTCHEMRDEIAMERGGEGERWRWIGRGREEGMKGKRGQVGQSVDMHDSRPFIRVD